MDFTKIMDEIARSHVQKVELGDYYDEDGILCCGECHTHKEFVLPETHPAYTLIGGFRSPCLCACREKAHRIKVDAERDREIYERILSLRSEAFPDSAMRDMTFERDKDPNSRISKLCRNFAQSFLTNWRNGKGLLLYGKTGVGKTFYAMAIAHKAVNCCIPTLATNFPRLLNAITEHFEDRQTYIDGLNRFPLLVIDDMGVENGTDNNLQHMFSVVNGRYLAKLPMVITTNLTLDQLQHPKDVRYQRIFERILERCYPVEYKGINRRSQKAQEDIREMRSLFEEAI